MNVLFSSQFYMFLLYYLIDYLIIEVFAGKDDKTALKPFNLTLQHNLLCLFA